jgi:hypothetical protein
MSWIGNKKLCAASNLVERTFDRVRLQGQNDVTSMSRHLNLRRLWLGKARDIECSADVLRYLTLPSLENLWISPFDIEHDTFLHFLTPPLRSLSIHISRVEWSLGQSLPAFARSDVSRACKISGHLSPLTPREDKQR